MPQGSLSAQARNLLSFGLPNPRLIIWRRLIEPLSSPQCFQAGWVLPHGAGNSPWSSLGLSGMSQTALIVLPLGVVLKSNIVGSSLSQLTGP